MAQDLGEGCHIIPEEGLAAHYGPGSLISH